MNILMPSAGRRFLHLQYIKECIGVTRLVTTEIKDDAPGIFSADICYRVPRANSPDYFNAILKICEKEKIDAIILMLDLDIDNFSENREMFEKRNIKLLLSPKETIEMALDKYKTAKVLKGANVPTPFTVTADKWDQIKDSIEYPILIKPRFPSRRAAGKYIISALQNEEEVTAILDELGESCQDYVLQEYLSGTELTVDFFCDENGKMVACIPGERLGALSQAFSQNGGAISEGCIFHSDKVSDITKKLTEAVRFYGPSNFQAYRNEAGEIKITEINPRVTGATVMTKASGYDLFQWSVDLLNGKEVKQPEDDFKDIRMVSWTKPIFFEESTIEEIE